MEFVYTLFEWLLVIAFVGLIGVLVWLVIAALALKNGVMRDAKRIYERPLNSAKSLVGTGKGIALQEGVRFRHIASDVKIAAAAVRETAGEVKTAANAIPVSELKSVLSNMQNIVKLLNAVGKATRSASAKQGAA